MKTDGFKKLIKEAVREVIQEELKDILWVTLLEENKNLQRPELLQTESEIEE